MSPLLYTTFQNSSMVQEPEACPACQKYGSVPNCESQDLSPGMYLILASTLTNPTNTMVEVSCEPTEEILLWHANLLSVNPALITQLIDNILTYVDRYTFQQCADDIEFKLSNHDVHVARELKFIFNTIKNLKDGSDEAMLNLLRQYPSQKIEGAATILMKNVKYSRLFPLLCIMFFDEFFDDKDYYNSNIASKPATLTRQNAMMEFESQPSSPVQTHSSSLLQQFKSLSITPLASPKSLFDDDFSFINW